MRLLWSCLLSPRLVPPSNQIERLALPLSESIIWRPIKVQIEVPLYPLKHLKIILVLGLHQLSRLQTSAKCRPYVYVSGDADLLQRGLEYLVVEDVLIVVLRLPVHLAHFHYARVYRVQHLAIHGPRGTLLHFLNVQLHSEIVRAGTYLEKGVEPSEQLVLADEEGLVHDPDVVPCVH